MADRKPTVVNPAGYQENLQDEDNLIVTALPTEDNHVVNRAYLKVVQDEIDGDIDLAGRWSLEGTKLYPRGNDQNVLIGGSLPNSPAIELNVDGSASFSSDVTISGDITNVGSITATGKITSASTVDSDTGTTVITKDYLSSIDAGDSGQFGYWSRTSNRLTPSVAGDIIEADKVAVGKTGDINNKVIIESDTQFWGMELRAPTGANIKLGGYDENNRNGFAQFYKSNGDIGALIKGENNSYFTGGNVGFGTNAPGYPVTVAANADSKAIRLAGRASDNRATLQFTNSSQGTVKGNLQADDDRVKLTGADATSAIQLFADGKNAVGDVSLSRALFQVVGGTPDVPVLGEEGAPFVVGRGTAFGLQMGSTGGGNGYIQAGRMDGTATAYNVFLQPYGGKVGIQTADPKSVLHIKSSDVDLLKVQRTSVSNSAISFQNATSQMFAGLGSDAVGWGIGSTKDIGTEASFFVQRVNKNVGIGTLNPSARLEIRKNEADGDELLRFDTARPWVFKQSFTGAATTLDLQAEGGGKFFRITGTDEVPSAMFFRNESTLKNSNVRFLPDGGNVGIGVSADASYRPEANLHIGTAGIDGVPGIYLSTTRSTATTSDIAIAGTSVFRAVSGQNNVVSQDGYFRWLIDSDDADGTNLTKGITDGTELMRLSSAGRLGIGTNSPATKLHVEGSQNTLGYLKSTNAFCSLALADTSGSGAVQTTLGSIRIMTDGDAGKASTNSTESARFSKEGLAVGKTSAAGRLDLYQTSTTDPGDTPWIMLSSSNPMWSFRNADGGNYLTIDRNWGSTWTKALQLNRANGKLTVSMYDLESLPALP